MITSKVFPLLRVTVCLLLTTPAIFAVSSYPKLLVVSYDGFRYDYFDRHLTPIMDHLKNEGTSADYMISAFVTRTLPNHHTMATGFYIETHGVLESRMLYPNGSILEKISDVFHYDNNILPIWTMNEKSGKGRHSGAMMWPGSEFNYNGTTPTFFSPLNITISWKDKFDKLISWFLHPSTPINFGILYIEEPDLHGHAFGTKHPEMDKMLRKLDNFTKYIYETLEQKNLSDVNVIHLSDHGMTDVNISRIVNITDIIDKSNYNYVATANTIFVQPHIGKEKIVYDELKTLANETGKFDVYRKQEIPEKLHYGKNDRMTDIYVVAKNGYAFEFLRDSFKYFENAFNVTITNESLFGLHGYDNEDPQMRPIFFARGPAFKSHCKLKPFHNVDLFPLFCHVLNLKCPPTNGTLHSFEECLTPIDEVYPSYSSEFFLKASIILVCICLIIGISIATYLNYKHRQKEIVYRILDEAKTEQLWDEHQIFENI